MKNSISNGIPSKYFIPYEYGSSTFEGCDCYGFVKLYYKCEFGIELFDYRRSGGRATLPADTIEKHKNRDFYEITDPKDHDVVFMFDSNMEPKHVGIYKDGYIFHSLELFGVVGQKANLLKKKIISFHRLKGME